MRQSKHNNKPAQVIEMDAHDRAIEALAAIKEANKGKAYVKVEIPHGYKEVEIGKHNHTK